jgi:cyclic pyranopterin phosphate synthase
MPEEGVAFRPHAEILSFESIARVVRAGADLGIRKVRLTGGEPLVRKNLPGLVAQLTAIPGIERVAMTTNGSLLARYASALRDAGMDSINVSLDTLDPEKFRGIARRGRLEDVLDGIDAAVAAGFFPMKLNMVVAPETTREEIETMRIFAESKSMALQLIAHYRLDVRKHDEYSFDRPPNCGACNRLRLTADGTLKPCLHSNIELPVDLADPAASFREAARLKPAAGTVCTNRTMMSIGG